LAHWGSVIFSKRTARSRSILARFSSSTAQNAALMSARLRAYCAPVRAQLRCRCTEPEGSIVFLFPLILYFAIAFCLLVCLLFFSIFRLGGFRGFQNVLLRVALKHRGSVAAGLRCGLWPADSVGCGDCGLAASVFGGTRGGSSVGTFASSTAPTRCRETRRLAVTAFCRGAARLAYLSARIPPRVNQSHH
jgi:hypothetical protein